MRSAPMMNAPATTFEPENPPHIFDFGECALDDQGRARWAEVIALQAHIMVTRLEAEIGDLRRTAPSALPAAAGRAEP